MPPQTHYTKSGDIHIAYQVIGDGPPDMLFVPSVSHLDVRWEEPSLARAYERISKFCRLIMFDKRGTGLSDRGGELPLLEQQMDDVTAVLEAAGSKEVTMFGIVEGGALASLFTASHPERVTSLVLYGTAAKFFKTDDYPFGMDRKVWDSIVEQFLSGSLTEVIQLVAPSRANDEGFRTWFTRYLRMSANPGELEAVSKNNFEVDLRGVLPTIHVPTLILHRTSDRLVSSEAARFLSSLIEGSKLVELEGDSLFWAGDLEILIDEVEEFITGDRTSREPEKLLTTVMFTDIVGSTEEAARLGDNAWQELLKKHDAAIDRQLTRFRGVHIKATGDGVLATFDGPGRAIECARAIVGGMSGLGLQVRVGLHTGECFFVDSDIGGIAVTIAKRVSELAGPGQAYVSSTVRDLVVGSRMEFKEVGARSLKGISESWRIFEVG